MGEGSQGESRQARREVGCEETEDERSWAGSRFCENEKVLGCEEGGEESREFKKVTPCLVTALTLFVSALVSLPTPSAYAATLRIISRARLTKRCAL